MNSAPGQDRSSSAARPSRRRGAGGLRPETSRSGRSARGTGGGRTDADRRRRELSQNYLRSPEAARQFLKAVHLDADGLCIEVGAGEGILTTRLAAMTGEVIAYEIDRALADRLIAKVGDRPNVKVRVGDFLTARQPSRPFQVVGNAPFSLTSPIVDWCLHASRMTTATLITQLEYARKRTGGYGRWSQLTVSTWPQVRWDLLGTIARTEFRPVPRVDAAILRLERRAEPLIGRARLAAYRRLVQAGFSGVGGSVQASLRRTYPAEKVAAACSAAGVDRRAVVGYVSPDQWVRIFLELDAALRAPARARVKDLPAALPPVTGWSGRAGTGPTVIVLEPDHVLAPARLSRRCLSEGQVGYRRDAVHRARRQVDRVARPEVLTAQIVR
jgi:23S rRNA (adenine-N6)-dimethyltransferase